MAKRKRFEIHMEPNTHHGYCYELEMVKSESEEPADFAHYSGDIARLVRVMAARGYECSRVDAYNLWNLYSADMCAGWMMMRDLTDESVFRQVKPFFREVA